MIASTTSSSRNDGAVASEAKPVIASKAQPVIASEAKPVIASEAKPGHCERSEARSLRTKRSMSLRAKRSLSLRAKRSNQTMSGYVYIICNKTHTTLYVGVTSNLAGRITQHKNKDYPKSFSAKYNCNKLVYYKRFDSISEAIDEEKRIKGGSRKQKEKMVNSMNPEWRDLYEEIKFW